MAESAVVQPPKYTPRASAADFVKGLPQLGVEQPEPTAIAPAPAPAPEPAPEPTPTPEPAPKPAAPTPAPAPAPAPVEAKIPRTAKDWDAYKAAEKKRLEEREARIAELQSKVTEFEKAPKPAAIADDDPRIVQTRKEAEELSERLRLVDIERHPKFKAFYENKVSTQIEMAKRIVGTENAEAIATLLKLPDNQYRQEKIEEMVANLSPIQQSRVGGVLNALNEIEVERSGQIEQAKKDYEKYQADSKTKAEQQVVETKAKVEAGFTAVLSTLQNPKDKDGLFIFQKQDGNDEWNKGVEERVNYAKNLIFGDNKPETLMRAILHAAALPGVVKSYQVSLDKIKTLEDQVAGLSASQPRLETRQTPEGGEGAPRPKEKGNARVLGSREMAGDWVKGLNETQQALQEQ